MTFSRFPPPYPPRGIRRDWALDLALPTRLELYCHGLVERNIATYGFIVLDVGVNRQLIAHGAPAAEGKGVTPMLAHCRALVEGLHWLIRQKMHRRRTMVHTDSREIYIAVWNTEPPDDPKVMAPICGARDTLGRFDKLELRLISEQANALAVGQAERAYVTAQENRRRARAPEVLPELHYVEPGLYLVGQRYKVNLRDGTCSCPDFQRMHSDRYPIRCKHLLAVIEAAQDRGGAAEQTRGSAFGKPAES